MFFKRQEYEITSVDQLDQLINVGGSIIDTSILSPQMQKMLDLYKQSIISGEDGYLDDAIQISQQLLDSAPDFIAPRVNVADYLATVGEIDEAFRHLEIAHQYAPEDPDVHIAIGLIYDRLDDKQREIEQYQEALRDDPHSIKAMNNLGKTYHEIRDFENAEYWLLQAFDLTEASGQLQEKPGNITLGLLNNLTDLYLAIGDWGLARHYVRVGISFDPESLFWSEKYRAVGEFASRNGLSFEVFSKVTDMLDYGVEIKRQGDYQQAKTVYQQAIAMDPIRAMGFYSLAKLCYLRGEQREAIENYLKAAHLVALYDELEDPRSLLEEALEIDSLREPIEAFRVADHLEKLLPILANNDFACHLAHALVDLDAGGSLPPAIKDYIPTYRMALKGGPAERIWPYEYQFYLPIGLRYLLQNLRWDRSESVFVNKLY